MSGWWIMLTGSLVAISCGILGCFLVLRRLAMVGDAISHAILPGIVIAYLLSGSRDSLVMLFGAALIGLVTVFLIQWFQNSGIPSDASIGVVFTALFSVGVILVSLYTRQIDLDLDCVLFGEIAFVPFDRLIVGSVDIGRRGRLGIASLLLARGDHHHLVLQTIQIMFVRSGACRCARYSRRLFPLRADGACFRDDRRVV